MLFEWQSRCFIYMSLLIDIEAEATIIKYYRRQ